MRIRQSTVRGLLLTAGLVAAILTVPGMAIAETLMIPGNQWLQGQGVDVYKERQCVELPQSRLYPKFGWPKVYAAVNGGAAYIPEGSPGLVRYNPGSGYVPVPGDLIIENPYGVNVPYGHVAVVDYTEGNTIHAVQQNGANARRDYTYNGSSYAGGYGSVKCVMHAPQNGFTNPSAVGSPFGSLDSVATEQPGTVRVRGWDVDPNAPTQAIAFHVYVGGPAGSANAEGFALTANGYRPDVGAAYPGVGNSHGYDSTIVTSKRGAQSVYVYGINAPGTPGDNVLLGSGTVTIASPDPFGSLDLVTSEQPGTVRVRGWDVDPNTPTKAIDFHVYVGGPAGSANAEGFALTANGYRPDVNAVYPGVGNSHGYDRTIATSKRGAQSVYVYGINAPATPGVNVLLGSGTVTIEIPRISTSTKLASPTGVRLKKKHTFSGVVTPSSAGGDVRLAFTRFVGGKWKSAGAYTVTISSGKFSRNFMPTHRGKWKLTVAYAGQNTGSTVYLAAKKVTRSFKVK